MLEKNGLVKLVEECGELIQIAAKKMTRMDSDEHWDGQGKISERLENEIADVIAATYVVIGNFGLDKQRILDRASIKRKLFRQWMKESDESLHL